MEPTTTPTPQPAPTPQAEFREIVAQANNGDRDALVRLRQTLDANPSVWSDISRTAIESERTLIEHVAGGDRLIGESMQRSLKQMRTDLAGPSPTLAEKMAVDRVVVAWLLLQIAEKALVADRGSTLAQANFILKRHEFANRQYAGAVKSLRELQERLPKVNSQQPNSKPGLRIFDGGEDVSPEEQLPTGTCSPKP